MWNLVKNQIPEKKRIKENNEIVDEVLENDDPAIDFSKVSEHCHITNVRETGISKKFESTISTCFISILHLANDKNLLLEKEGNDFKIFKHISAFEDTDANDNDGEIKEE